MTTNETVFFVRGSYILLVDLESWYDNAFVTPEDEVRMIDGKKKQVCTIKDLIKNYGCRFPFRRGNDSLIVNDFGYGINDENLIPDFTKYSKGQLLGARSMERELELNISDEILKELGPMDLTDYPLFNLDNEPEEDRITGKDVEAEFMKLRNSLVIKNWNQLYADYFDFLERGYKGDGLKRTQPICRLCNETPRHLFHHLFSNTHFKNITLQSVSRKSFEFWEYQFRECIYECGQSFGADLRTYDYIEGSIKCESTEVFYDVDSEIEEIEAISPSYSPSQLLAQRSLATKINLKPPVGPQRPPQPQQMPPQLQHQNEQQMGNQGSYEIDQFRPEGPPPVQGYKNNAQQAQYYAGSVIQQGVPYQQGYSGGEGGGPPPHEPAPIMQLMPPHGQQAPQHIQKAGIYGMQMPTAMYIPMPPPIVVRRQPVVNSRSDTVKDSGNQSSAWKNKRKSEIEQLEEGPQSQHETSVQQQQPPPPPPQQHQQQPQPPQGYQEFVPKLSYCRSQLLAQRSLKTTVDLNLSKYILKELGPMDLIDYPLLNVDNEPEEDRITGEAILKEFSKLKQTWVLQNWNSKYAKYFEYLDRGYKGNGLKRTQPICRICIYNGKPKNLMKHLFGSFHSGYMKNHSVSLRSFKFWSQKLQECLEKCGKISGVYIGNYDQQVLKAYKDQKEQKKKNRREKRELEVAINEELAEMFDEEESKIEETGSISALNKLRAEPSLEEMMSLIVSEMKSKKVGPMDLDVENEPGENRTTENRELEMPINEQLTDMLNAEKIEIEEIETISPSYSRSQLLAQRSLETTVKLNLSEDILKELGLMDLIDYPLLNVDNEPEEDRITGDAILKEFNKLKQSCVVKHWNILYALHFEFLNRGYKGDGLKMTQPICRICNMRPAFALQHLLSYKHKENLKSHSVSLRSFEFWSQKFEECTKRCGKVASVFVCEARPID
ncbi:hypothetical protein B9Z55_000234 [Caenorhabditis nigoni]|nr:hypothetical protein B9Z55_000234 [Caenorhabditis nigoni]